MTNIIELIRYFFLTICIFLFIYSIYQLLRNQKVYKIRCKWTNDYVDEKWYKYSYDYMMKPKKHNWFGFKWPNENDYK